jgi:large subunit ribosomal protein L29
VKLQIVNNTLEELYANLHLLKKELLNFRIQKSSGSMTNTSQIRKNRRNVARIKTHLMQLNKNKLLNGVT